VLLSNALEADIGIWFTDPDLLKRGVDCVIVLIAFRIVSLVVFSPVAAEEAGTGDILNGVATKGETEEDVVEEPVVTPAPLGIANFGKLPPR
jgi:hypothetical protein